MSLILVLALAAQESWPGASWPTATPAQAGMDAAKLDQARDVALTGGGSGYITRGGRLVLSWGDPSTKYDLKSTTKSFGATALGVAIGDGKVSLTARAQTYHPSFGVPPSTNTATGWLDDITLKHLATQTAGFDKNGGYTALLFQPGTKWSYSDGGPNWLAECLTLTYKQDLNTMMWNRVFTPIGVKIAELSWRNNQYRPLTIGGYPNREFGSGINASVDAMARLGLLYLREGRWSSGQILPQSFVTLARQTPPEVKGKPVTLPGTYDDASNHYGLLWWNNNDGKIPTVPTDAYWSWGLFDSWIIVIPSLDIVASRAGQSLQSGWTGHYGRIRPFIEPIAQSVQAAPPPPSTTHRLWFAAKNGTLAGRMARSSDYAAGSLAGQLVYPNLDAYNTSNTTQADSLTLSNVLLPASGTWYLWARMYYPGTTAQPTNDPNSFWVSADGAAAQTLGNLSTKDRTWHWSGAGGTRLTLGSLSAAEHTIRIWNREARETATAKLSPRLDVVLLTNDAAYVPQDADAPSFGGGTTPAPTGGAPYPASPVITGLTWADKSTITRKASGSDNWPMTWADDGDLYTAYGDGHGFDPKIPTKLSLGFAKVSGEAPGTGANIRSATGETTGDGQRGKKASGMLMVGGTLYMWTRNADGAGKTSQLAWSTDHAKTWTWASWTFAEFGYLTFVNYGRNYAGARDGYVYCVTHDNPSAYVEADRFVLLRVPTSSLKTKSAWQVFTGKDASGAPQWSSTLSQRAAVFSFAGRCRRSQISYNPVLKRYLWWQMYHEDGVDQRFAGGFGVYDAPEPWGPWTTAYFTTSWDVGPGETGGFPTKWMSADGKTIHLVFSGNDAFSVRKATLTASSGSGGAPPPSPSVVIERVSTGKPYSLAPAQTGRLHYIDRSYTITSLSSALSGGTLIRTANDDKAVTATSHLTLALGAPGTVYVGYDKRASTVPSWLNDGTWTLTSETLALTDTGASPMRVYRKSAAAGTLTLGGNRAGGGAGAGSHYVVIVKMSSTAARTAADASLDGPLPGDVWEHPGDADGDGLYDATEAAVGTDPASVDTDGNGVSDEAELGPDGRTLWDAQASDPAPAEDGGSPRCGLMGIELLVLLAFAVQLKKEL